MIRAFEESNFPSEDLIQSRRDPGLQAANASVVNGVRIRMQVSVRCPDCGAGGSELAWFFFKSPPPTWAMLCGRAGVIAYCERDNRQVAFFLTIMN